MFYFDSSLLFLKYLCAREKIFATTYFPTGLAICPPYLAQPTTLLTSNNFNPSLVQPPNNINTTNTINSNQYHPQQTFYPSIQSTNNSLNTSTNYQLNPQQHHHHHLHSTTTNIQINHPTQTISHLPTQASATVPPSTSTAAAATTIPLCYCGHCCPPPPVVSAITPTVILSRYTEINLCDTFSLRNQTAASINNCSTVFANNNEHNHIVNGTILPTNTSNNNHSINSNGNSSGHTNQFGCKEIMVSNL